MNKAAQVFKSLLHGARTQGMKLIIPSERFGKVLATSLLYPRRAIRYMADGTAVREVDDYMFLLNSNIDKLRGAKGSVYKLSPKNFKLDPHKGNLPWVYSSPKSEKVLSEQKHNNVLISLNENKIISVPEKYYKYFTNKKVSKDLLEKLIDRQKNIVKLGSKISNLKKSGAD